MNLGPACGEPARRAFVFMRYTGTPYTRAGRANGFSVRARDRALWGQFPGQVPEGLWPEFARSCCPKMGGLRLLYKSFERRGIFQRVRFELSLVRDFSWPMPSHRSARSRGWGALVGPIRGGLGPKLSTCLRPAAQPSSLDQFYRNI